MTGFLRGSATAMITPFGNNGVNFESLKRMIAYQAEGGTDALVILGTTGEPSTMSEKERNETIEFALKCADGKIKIIVGTGSNNTESAYSMTEKAKVLGADGVLAVTPYYNKCTQNGIVGYYRALAEVGLPLIAYNVPGRTGVNILPETAERLAEIPNLAGIKEASGNMAQVMETMRRVRGKCDVYSGEDALNLPILLSGGTAVISVVSNLVPKMVKELTATAFARDLDRAIALSDALLPLASACFCEVNPIPVKAGMNLLGFDAGVPRPPLTELEPQHLALLRAELEKLGREVHA